MGGATSLRRRPGSDFRRNDAVTGGAVLPGSGILLRREARDLTPRPLPWEGRVNSGEASCASSSGSARLNATAASSFAAHKEALRAFTPFPPGKGVGGLGSSRPVFPLAQRVPPVYANAVYPPASTAHCLP